MNQPPAKRRTPRPQISLSLMLFLMLVFAMMSAGLFYASRVPAIQDEIAILTGQEAKSRGEAGRLAHIAFIMFTLTSPLLLALLLSVGVSVYRWFDKLNR